MLTYCAVEERANDDELRIDGAEAREERVPLRRVAFVAWSVFTVHLPVNRDRKIVLTDGEGEYYAVQYNPGEWTYNPMIDGEESTFLNLEFKNL